MSPQSAATIPLQRTLLLAWVVLLLACTHRASAVAIYAVNQTNGLLSFDSTTPGTVTGPTAITGLVGPPGEIVIGIDFRPANGQLYGVTFQGNLYTINPTTAVATLVAPLTADPTDTTNPYTGISGTEFGLDFNPVPDRLRLVTSAEQNLRINPTNGLVITDGPLAYAAGDPNAAANPTIEGAAYTNNFAGASTTRLYDIDFALNSLVVQNPPNDGTLNTVGPLGVAISASETGFDITATNQAFAAFRVSGTTNLYTINLITGAATSVGAVGGNPLLRGITALVAPPLTLDVNSTNDGPDAAIGNGICETATLGECTLRAAIQESNADASNRDTITFSITEGVPGIKTITPATALPTIVAPVVIDGYTQSGATPNTAAVGSNAVLLIELNGTSAGASDGLIISSSAPGSNVRGLVINRFTSSGIRITGTGITIEGCFIGTNAAGTVGLANGNGVNVELTRENFIGGNTPAARNLISGNNVDGIRIVGTIGVGGDASSNQVRANLIGTDVSGTQDLGNGAHGVLISGPAVSNLIGGSEAGARNVISGNGGDGVQIFVSGANSNVVQGNFIGTDATGTQDLGNSQDGVRVRSGVSNIIGGSSPGAGNVISGNNSDGVQLGIEGATTTTVAGNFIGTDVTGSQDLGNSLDGVFIDGSPNNIIGGTSPGARNLISGNNDDGIHIVNGGSTGNLVIGNFIGTTGNGASPLPNNDTGVLIAAAPNNTVGGVSVEERNIISGNGGNGVSIVSGGATGNLVRGNYIGTSSDGAGVLGNGTNGVLVGISSNTIGGNPGAGNTVAHNTGDGVQIQNVTDIPIFGNSIFSNGGLGINLLGPGEITGTVTFNDFDDSDTGANNLQNFPILESAMSNGGTTTITGTLTTTPGDYFIDFYSNEAADPSGHGEGERPLGDLRVTASERGEVTFSFTVPADLAGKFVAATASPVTGGGTSEFGPALLVSSPASTPTPTPSPTATASPTPTATATPTPTASPTATATPTATPSPTASPSPSPSASPAAQALNISTRLRVETGDNVLIGGFIIRGNVPKKIIARALGASLEDDGVEDFLEDPILELHGPDGELIAQNDNWRDDQEADIEASGLAPEDESESAITATLPPEGYTVVLRGNDGTTGVALLEGYDLEPASDSSFRNISTRGFVQTGEGVMIGGFILDGTAEGTTVVLRGIGPSLAGAGLSNVLQDPTIDLRDGNGNRIAFSNDWMENPAQAVQLTASGLAPSDSRESGIFTKLPPGGFTVILAGANGGTGIGLVEIYNLGN